MESWFRFGSVGFALFTLYVLFGAMSNAISLFETNSFAAFFLSVISFAVVLGLAIPVSIIAGIVGFIIFAVLQFLLDLVLVWPIYLPKRRKGKHSRKAK